MIETSWEESVQVLDRLPSLPVDERAPLLERLLRSGSAGVREQALRVGAVVLPDETLVDYLRADSDAVLRNAGLEILKSRGKRSFQLAVEILSDEDLDVALQAVLILDHLRDPRAVEPLRGLLDHEDVNILQATLVALGHLGGPQTVDDLLPFLDADPWLQIASIQGLGDLRSPTAIAPLRDRLTDLMVGPLAAEALAHIGGPGAFEALAEHWLHFHDDLDPETTLGLLAHVLSGLERFPAETPGLRAALSERLRDPYRAVRVCAARCLLALGAGPEDGAALSILADARKTTTVLPSSLSRRHDLAAVLMQRPGHERAWGFLLGARYPEAVEVADVAAALQHEVRSIAIAPVVALLSKREEPELAGVLIDLFLRLEPEDRAALQPVLEARSVALSRELERRGGIAEHDHIVLSALLGRPAEEVATRVIALPPHERDSILAQLAGSREVMRQMPWEQWLEESPERYLSLAGTAAVASNLAELLPSLREPLRMRPTLEAVRAVGVLRDCDSVEALLPHLDGPASLLQVATIESLGRIGGPDARSALTGLALSGDDHRQRLAYRALSECAIEEDEPVFRNAVSHPDWCVRLASATVLGRFARPENRESLARLAADPVSIVSERALAQMSE